MLLLQETYKKFLIAKINQLLNILMYFQKELWTPSGLIINNQSICKYIINVNNDLKYYVDMSWLEMLKKRMKV